MGEGERQCKTWCIDSKLFFVGRRDRWHIDRVIARHVMYCEAHIMLRLALILKIPHVPAPATNRAIGHTTLQPLMLLRVGHGTYHSDTIHVFLLRGTNLSTHHTPPHCIQRALDATCIPHDYCGPMPKDVHNRMLAPPRVTRTRTRSPPPSSATGTPITPNHRPRTLYTHRHPQ